MLAADMYLQAVFVDRLCRVALYCHGRVPGKVYSARSRLDMRSWLSALGLVFKESESESETVGTGQGERAEVGSQVTAGDSGLWRSRINMSGAIDRPMDLLGKDLIRSFASRSTFTTPPAFSPTPRHAHWHFRKACAEYATSNWITR
jgi:hypothetical protein